MNLPLLMLLIVREWRHHPWRHGAALLAVALGVALAYSVHLINSSALEEFSSAGRTANGEPDLTLRGRGFDDVLFERVAADPAVQLASPVLEIDTYARAPDGKRVAVRVLGIDTLLAVPLAPALLPRLAAGEDRLAFLNPELVLAVLREQVQGAGAACLLVTHSAAAAQRADRVLRLTAQGIVAQ